jgi:hypothetical protein
VDPLTEQHFTPGEIAKAWGLSIDSTYRLFRDEPGVLRIGTMPGRGRRPRVTMRIPASVMKRVYNKRTGGR